MIGIIGCGNMGSAIVLGIHKVYPDIKFKTYTLTGIRAQELATKVQGIAVSKLAEMSDCDSIIIGCKPQQFSSLIIDLKKANLLDKHFISIMAAISVSSIKSSLVEARISRVMPNTPAKIGVGISLVYHDELVDLSEQNLVLKIFSSCSQVYLIDDEKKFDQVTTVSGSGPAYIFFFAQCLCDELELMGLSSGESKKMVIQLFKGSAMLMEEVGDLSLKELVSQVTSKGGVTIEAIKVFREREMGKIFAEALGAAYKRSIELVSELK